MADPLKIYGRQYEVSWLTSKLFPAKNQFGVPPLVLLHGPNGCGTTFLSKALVAMHVAVADRSPLLVFEANASSGNGSVSEFSEALMLSADFTAPGLESEMINMKGDFKVRLNELRKDSGQAAEAYNLDGSVRNVPTTEPSVTDDPEGSELAAISVDAIHRHYQDISVREAKFAALRLLYIFDDFADYSPQVKRWIGGPFLEQFSQLKSLPAPGFLLTGKDSWDTGGQKDYWQKNPGTFFNLQVAPLDRDSCLEWLEDAGFASTYIDCLMEESEGKPGMIRHILETPGLLESKASADEEDQEFPFAVNARQRRWLHAAAMSEFVSEESLLLLLGVEEGQKALHWLESTAPVELVTVNQMAGDKHIHLRSPYREKVLNRCLAKVPARHQEFQDRFELQARVAERVPVAEDRESLRVLSPVQPFNSDILKLLFGNDE